MKKNSKHFKCLFIFLVTVCTVFCAGCSQKKEMQTDIISASNNPKRIVVLSPSGAEILCAVGAESLICARTDYCNYPSFLNDKPSIGGFTSDSVSVESIISYKPDLVYGSEDIHNNLVPQLKSLGIQVYLSKASSLNSIYDEILYIANLTGFKENGVKLVKDISFCAEEIQKKIPQDKKVSVYYEVWNTPFMSAGNKSFINDIINVCGGKNIFDNLESSYPCVSQESIIAKNPEVILIPHENGLVEKDILSRDGWESIDAVKNKRIYFLDSDIFSRPGPRVSQALSTLYNYLYVEK